MTLHTRNKPKTAASLRACIAIACAGILVTGCAVTAGSGGMGGGVQLPGGGVELPGGGSSGGSSGGGMEGGSSGGGMEGGSSGGGMSGGGMPGGMPGGSSGGSSGGQMGGSMGGSSGGGGSSGSVGGSDMEGVSIPGGGGGAGSGECNDGGLTGGGIGGDMGCEQGDGGGAGGVGEFPGDPEAAEELGKELDKSLGDFDESIGQEQREISSTSRNTEGFDTGSGGNRGGSISLGEQAAGAMGGGGSGGGSSGMGEDAPDSNAKSGGLASMDAQEVARRTPDDIEAVIDDDIVAKQLREAALAEEDPELRERLWEEYRKYKGM